MSRLLLLSILVLWMCPQDNVADPHWASVRARVGIFLGVYGGLVVLMSAWGRLLARRVGGEHLGRTLDRYNRATEWARYFVPAWFAVGLFALGWGRIVSGWMPLAEPYRMPGILIGTLPAFAAWMGLWWAQYPADRAFKEQSLLYHANEGLPIHAPPGFATFFVEHFRQQLCFTLAPILLIIAARDLITAGFVFFGSRVPRDGTADLLFLPVSILVFAAAPELLRRVIPTTPLPANWPLRKRLEAMCARAGLRYRDILLWRTNSSMGNAMVMGLFPRVRYIFLSDLLLETMKDEEIEAVFAHEVGHIVHRHMWWYLVFIVILMLFSMGPLSLAINHIPGLAIYTNMPESRQMELAAYQEQIAAAAGFAMFIVLFGLLSRRFERQADVYAARTMQAHVERAGIVIRQVTPEAVVAEGGAAVATATMVVETPPVVAMTPVVAGPSYVGEYGARVVAGALQRVARINNIPIAAGEWLHGSIGGRMRYLVELSADAGGTARFDAYMTRVYLLLVAVTVGLGVWVGVQMGV
jgi:STE24 endopeptidase